MQSQSTDFSIPVSHVSDTAFLVAAFRLAESKRPDRHFDDSLAAKLLGAKGDELLTTFPDWKFGEWMMAVRTVIIDHCILNLVNQGVTTVVNLASGLDTRPYRMSLPRDFNWIEVDYEGITKYKTERLKDEKPVCNLNRVCVDLADKGERESLLHSFGSLDEFAVLTEGLLLYLDPKDVDALSDSLQSHRNLRAWIMDITTKEAFQVMHHSSIMDLTPTTQKQVQFKFLPDDGIDYFVKRGWKLETFSSFLEGGRKLNRQTPDELRATADLHKFEKVGIGMLRR